MVLTGKLQAETLIKAPAHEFHEMFCLRPHHISNASPQKVQKCVLLQGDWGTPGSVIEWTYSLDGNDLVTKQVIEAVDEENKSVTFKLIEGDIMKEYTSFKAILKTIPKGDFTLVQWTLEYEKLNKDIPAPMKELAFLVQLNEHIDDHLVQA